MAIGFSPARRPIAPVDRHHPGYWYKYAGQAEFTLTDLFSCLLTIGYSINVSVKIKDQF
jgi:hypothetical protein